MAEKKETKLNDFEQTIKDYLDGYAKKDKLFADKKYGNPKKSIQDCCKYIISQAQKRKSGNVAAIADNEVYNMAIHYYDEDDIVVDASAKAEVVQSAEKPEKPKAKKISIKEKKKSESEEWEPLALQIPLFE